MKTFTVRGIENRPKQFTKAQLGIIKASEGGNNLADVRNEIVVNVGIAINVRKFSCHVMSIMCMITVDIGPMVHLCLEWYS
jgi:hypothetical protein